MNGSLRQARHKAAVLKERVITEEQSLERITLGREKPVYLLYLRQDA
jgi:hypothetical protein